MRLSDTSNEGSLNQYTRMKTYNCSGVFKLVEGVFKIGILANSGRTKNIKDNCLVITDLFVSNDINIIIGKGDKKCGGTTLIFNDDFIESIMCSDDENSESGIDGFVNIYY